MGVNKVLVRTLTEKAGKSEEDAKERLSVLGNKRFTGDVFNEGVDIGPVPGYQDDDSASTLQASDRDLNSGRSRDLFNPL